MHSDAHCYVHYWKRERERRLFIPDPPFTNYWRLGNSSRGGEIMDYFEMF